MIKCDTIEALVADEKRLGITCNYCGRFRYLNLTRFALETVVSEIADEMTCAKCGSPDVQTAPVSRTQKNGYWPAECS